MKQINYKDLTGMHFGRLTVLGFDHKDANYNYYWKVLCSCGNEKIVLGNSLKNKNTRSCGCLQKEVAKNMVKSRAFDLVGRRYGRLLVVSRSELIDCGDGPLWTCKCDCGNEKTIKGHNLLRGNTKSCGCLRKESASKRQSRNLIGKKFGKLTVLVQAGFDKSRKNSKWLCRCDCGKMCVVLAGNLTRGETKSCGCLRIKDLVGKSFGKLLVLEYAGQNRWGKSTWRCLCGCGKQSIILGGALTSGHTKSCGCSSGEWCNFSDGKYFYIRSSYEKRVINQLIGWNIDYSYEPKAFKLDRTTYIPDLYIPQDNTYIEIKGYLRDDAKRKLIEFNSTYSSVALRIVEGKDILEIENFDQDTLIDIKNIGTALNDYLKNLGE